MPKPGPAVSDLRSRRLCDRREQADSDVLRAAASSLNQFEGDGSFLENFQGGRLGAGGSASDSDADRCSAATIVSSAAQLQR